MNCCQESLLISKPAKQNIIGINMETLKEHLDKIFGFVLGFTIGFLVAGIASAHGWLTGF